MNSKENAINWFEIPVADLARAKKFYESIFDIEMPEMVVGDQKMYTFPYEPGGSTISGAIDKVIEKIEAAGGKVLLPKTEISPEIGHFCFFNDTEGNRMALHANA